MPLCDIYDGEDYWTKNLTSHHKIELGSYASNLDPSILFQRHSRKLILLLSTYVGDIYRAINQQFEKETNKFLDR